MELNTRLKLQLAFNHSNDMTYIPKDLGDCLVRLDKTLKKKEKEEIKSLPDRDDMFMYHFSLGAYLRNKWKLWDDSVLRSYFLERYIFHADDMSTIILVHYHDWLNGNKESWSEWEKSHQINNE